MDAEDLLKIILILVVIWIAIEIIGEFISVLAFLAGPFSSILGLIILVVIVLYLLDRI